MNRVPAGRWNKMNALMVLVAVCAGLAGCVTTSLDDVMRKQGYRRATREEMLRELTPSFPSPAVRKTIVPLPKEKLVGKWTTSYCIEARAPLLSQGYDSRTVTTMTAHTTYWFFEDGVMKTLLKMNGKEITSSGNWDYGNDILTMSLNGGDGKKHEVEMKVLWYADDEFEMRYADVSKYEDMLCIGGTKSAKCRYESNGVLHTQEIIGSTVNGSQDEVGMIMVEGPHILGRDNADE